MEEQELFALQFLSYQDLSRKPPVVLEYTKTKVARRPGSQVEPRKPATNVRTTSCWNKKRSWNYSPWQFPEGYQKPSLQTLLQRTGRHLAPTEEVSMPHAFRARNYPLRRLHHYP